MIVYARLIMRVMYSYDTISIPYEDFPFLIRIIWKGERSIIDIEKEKKIEVKEDVLRNAKFLGRFSFHKT